MFSFILLFLSAFLWLFSPNSACFWYFHYPIFLFLSPCNITFSEFPIIQSFILYFLCYLFIFSWFLDFFRKLFCKYEEKNPYGHFLSCNFVNYLTIFYLQWSVNHAKYFKLESCFIPTIFGICWTRNRWTGSSYHAFFFFIQLILAKTMISAEQAQ